MDDRTVIDVDGSDFAIEVIERSSTLPVVVDFWAAWCGPCRTLGPMLESAVMRRERQVVLAKVDVDRETGLAQRYGVQGIPAVYAFRDGEVVDRFTGAVPQAHIESFLDRLVPSETERVLALAAASTPEDARRILEVAYESDPAEGRLAVALAELLAAPDPVRAAALLEAHPHAPGSERVKASLALARASEQDPADLRARAESGDANALVDLGRVILGRGDVDGAIGLLIDAIVQAAPNHPSREILRMGLLDLLTLLGDDPRVAPARARLARALF